MTSRAKEGQHLLVDHLPREDKHCAGKGSLRIEHQCTPSSSSEPARTRLPDHPHQCLRLLQGLLQAWPLDSQLTRQKDAEPWELNMALIAQRLG